MNGDFWAIYKPFWFVDGTTLYLGSERSKRGVAITFSEEEAAKVSELLELNFKFRKYVAEVVE